MIEETGTQNTRGAALDRIERTERNYKMAFFTAVVVEASFIVGFLLLADLRNRTHVLMLIAAVAVYTIIALGLVALANHVTRSTLRVLKAIELLESQLQSARR